MKQTAVEFIEIHLIYNEVDDVYYINADDKEFVFDKAKAIEKEQIIDAYDEGQSNHYEYSEDNDVNWYDGKKYYNETYGK